MSRIGIYAGTFDPVHAGHVSFALQSLRAADLDMIYFLPERQPRHKQGAEHLGHRAAMLNRALEPHHRLGVLETDDVSFSVERTLPALKKRFADNRLVFLFGSDILPAIGDWPHAARFIKDNEFVIGLRAGADRAGLKAVIEAWPSQPESVIMFPSHAPRVSSGRIRQALRRRQPAEGLLRSVERYSDRHWLYVSFS